MNSTTTTTEIVRVNSSVYKIVSKNELNGTTTWQLHGNRGALRHLSMNPAGTYTFHNGRQWVGSAMSPLDVDFA